MEPNNTRKRPRSTSPCPPSSGTGKSKYLHGLPDGEVLASNLNNQSLRNQTLNKLLSTTASHELNYILDSDSVLKALTRIFLETLGWDGPIPTQGDPRFEASAAWSEHVNDAASTWATFCSRQLSKGQLGAEKLRLLEAVLVILRNLSFIAANLRLLAYSPDVLAILVGALYETNPCNVGSGDDSGVSTTTTGSSIALPALHTLVNLAPTLDVTGHKLLCDKLFLLDGASEETALLPSPQSFGQAANSKFGFGSLLLAKRLDTKEDIVQDVSKEMMLQLTQDYMVAIWSIFPALARVLDDPAAPRLVVMMAVELLQEFVNQARIGLVGQVGDQDASFPTTRSILANIPRGALQRLTELLYVPRLGSDSLEYMDPVHNIVTRVTTLKLLMGYDATVDTDLRDRALDVLVPLLELDSPRMATDLVAYHTSRTRNRLYDFVIPILTTQAGRSEAPQLAGQLLQELSKAKGHAIGFQYLLERILASGSKDRRIANLALNVLATSASEL